jgi:hypothetical protein
MDIRLGARSQCDDLKAAALQHKAGQRLSKRGARRVGTLKRTRNVFAGKTKAIGKRWTDDATVGCRKSGRAVPLRVLRERIVALPSSRRADEGLRYTCKREGAPLAPSSDRSCPRYRLCPTIRTIA